MSQVSTDDLLQSIAALAGAADRRAAARGLAAIIGCEDLVVFVSDPDIGHSLPAPRFPQTLRGAKAWREIVDCAITDGTATGNLTGENDRVTAGRAIGSIDGTVVVLLGGSADEPSLAVLQALLPLIGALLRNEAVAGRAEAESMLARKSAAEAAELAAKLDAMKAELQRALSVAETATRARDDFLATVSHELRTPLTSIIGWIRLLREQQEPSLMAEGLDTIDRNARAQSRLIEDILDFSRINAGKLRLDVRPLELVDVIDSAIEIVRPAADARNVRIGRILDPNAGRVSGDPDRLQQVIWNLLSNAVKFTPRGGRVQIRLERVNSDCEITVTDTGEGISPDFLPFVFDRFSQADSTTTRTHKGLGLGLGIVRHLVELHGGTVRSFSPGPGEGATFVVRLPVIVAHHRPEGTAAPPHVSRTNQCAVPAELEGIRVLVVEDNDDARHLLTTILSRAGAAVQSAGRVPIALQLFSLGPPDIIVSDIEMPGEDGYSLIRKIRFKEQPSRRVPAIALTAYARSVDRVRALAAGFQVHMTKPVEPAELVAAVKSLVLTQQA